MISGSDFHEEEDLALGGITAERLPSDMRELCSLLRSGEYDLIKDGNNIKES
ncbi:hypothetical protein [Halanaerobium sp.]|jgi:hypothetical protein|uniref:hypothetical protein n=1 Tax=Halanaerobium sp. TaxID=1895664 RepID=UPI000DE5E888|nr:hypothetical protein [Halanaerobium sp.]PUU87979.1 MAG: Uncharacterized protein CI949_3301 [Halanaerobium sp.]